MAVWGWLVEPLKVDGGITFTRPTFTNVSARVAPLPPALCAFPSTTHAHAQQHNTHMHALCLSHTNWQGLRILAKINSNSDQLWFFLSAFDPKVWAALILTSVGVGLAVWLAGACCMQRGRRANAGRPPHCARTLAPDLAACSLSAELATHNVDSRAEVLTAFVWDAVGRPTQVRRRADGAHA